MVSRQALENERDRYEEDGREEGLEEGVEKGREEEKLHVARNLLDKLPDNEIAEITGLSLQEIRRLREEESRKN